MKKRRNFFAELKEGLESLAADREGKVTLNKFTVAAPVAAEVRRKNLKPSPNR